ncbi:AraC family transcriptional regulator [Tsuneonella sp. YG55]|uniref:AraC family transcriptional regulator n=1 Tax=Tsuneonella litorea TaxID=2976475 RepID=A0A9X2W1U3_9SPHN|nr:AraC family transcriptional regulator [Tsuneonella litorea]MCT2559527.1 AraC family transcriptional regulator [Tsuneonella litorea]
MGRDQSDVSQNAVPDQARLTRADLLRMELIAPPDEAAGLATTFYRVRCDEAHIRDVQPSSIGILILLGKGTGTLRFLDDRVERGPGFTLVTPTSAATTLEMEGPWDAFGAMLSPVGWASLTGLSAAEHGNRVRAAAEVVRAPLADAGEAILRDYDSLSDGDKAAILARGMAAAARPLPPRHVAFIRTVAEWLARSLSPPLADLYDSSGYGPRQVQRLTERYFGLAPATLVRKYRALRAAVLLAKPGLSDEDLGAIQDHFYDQSHMIREIRMFAGRTPARIADPDMPFLSRFLDLRNFRQAGPRLAPIPADLRA